ncbi:insulinase family protein [Pseudomonas sp. FME51]|uniref:insulinase family protein n=1 Tax=Pseudomonas sp. FME51 TaxID=2742609 RepID=UPI00186691C2|nr:insulinase family protein [Pseudomonas sp. FME51]
MHPLDFPRTPADGRHYQLYRAPSGLLCLLISDSAADTASCVVQFGVGSHDEPQHLPGLAHLLEHMLFMGSADYPQAGSFPQLVSEWSGRFNASTAAERTRYHFSVNPAGLEACLAQLADMLAAPLFSPEAVAAERQVIDAEFHTRLADDALHEQAALGQVFHSDHPLSRFSAGNRISLHPEPPALAQALRQFHAEHYRAPNGCVLIHAPLPLKQLMLQADKLAERLPAEAPMPRASTGPLFSPEHLPGLLRWQSRGQHEQWLLLFALDNVHSSEDAKALRWLCEWLTSPAPAGGLGWLRARGLAAQLRVSTQRYTGQQTLLRIEIEPLLGASDYPALLDGFFGWLEALRATPIQGWPQTARQQLADQTFANGPQGEPPLRWLTALAERTLYEPAEHILESTGQWADLSESAWHKLLTQLQPAQLLLAQSQNDGTTLPQQANWTDTRFAWSRLAWQPDANSADRLSTRDWPIWIVTAPETVHGGVMDSLPGLHTIPVASPQASAGQGRETTRIAWCWPSGTQDREQRERLIARWSIQLEPLSNWASACGISLSWQEATDLISLELQGPQQVLWIGASAALAALTPQPDMALQRLVEHRHAKTLDERRHALPAYRLLDELDVVLNPAPCPSSPSTEADPAAAQIAWLYPQEWQPQHLGPLGAKLQVLCPQLNQAFQWHPPKSKRLGEGTETVQVDCQHPDRAQILYCQASGDSVSERACWQLLQQLISASFFDQLRTRQQLGYWVVARYHEVAGTPGLMLLVQSPTHDHDQIEAAITAWMETEQTRLAVLSFVQIEQQAQRLADHLRTQSTSPAGQLELHWARALDLPRASISEQCHALQQLSSEQWQQTLQDWLVQPRRLHLFSQSV